MKKKRFKAQVLDGHKAVAVQVPFDPIEVWGIAAKPLWRGRHGHSVHATVNGFSFETSIVPRQKRLYLLIDAEVARSGGISAGEVVQVAVEPCVD
jgi:hypothetical protein